MPDDRDPTAWGEGGASQPRLESVNYKGIITGDPATVARIHKTDRKYDLLETVTLTVLSCIITITSALIVVNAPTGRETIILYMAIPGWVLSFGLGGFAAFRVRLSKSGLDLTGNSVTHQNQTKRRT